MVNEKGENGRHTDGQRGNGRIREIYIMNESKKLNICGVILEINLLERSNCFRWWSGMKAPLWMYFIRQFFKLRYSRSFKQLNDSGWIANIFFWLMVILVRWEIWQNARADNLTVCLDPILSVLMFCGMFVGIPAYTVQIAKCTTNNQEKMYASGMAF